MAALAVALVVLLVASMCVGRTDYRPEAILRFALAGLGLADPLVEPDRTIVELRVWRALNAAGVGAALALSGGLVQGLFRNGLAAPSLIGVTGGASLGAAIAILMVGGYAPNLVLHGDVTAGTLLIPLFGFLGALGATTLITALAAREGRISTPTLLLFGIAANMCIAGAFAAIQSFMLEDWEATRAIMAWTFGTLEDRSVAHVAVIWSAVVLAAALIPVVARELDLLQGGEADAESLGVNVGRVKLASLVGASLAAAAAVAVAGQIAFIGLVVPHFVRILTGSGHRTLLPLCVLGGAVFLVGADLLQRIVLGEGALQPGVTMSLVGGPFFVYLLASRSREVRAW